MIWVSSISSIFFIIVLLLLTLRFLRRTSVLCILKQWWISFENRFHVYQSFKIPLHNEHSQENQLYRQILTYLNSLPSMEDSDFTNLFSGSKPGEIFLHLNPNQTVHDAFLGAKVSWTNEIKSEASALVLRIKKKDKRRIFRPYFQHILSVADEIEQRRKDIKLYMNNSDRDAANANSSSRWRSVPFNHPASFDTLAMDGELKNKVKSDLEQFLKSKQYYHRLGRVWKRSYLLYGSSGTGKSSFIAAMAKFLCYDVYDIDISNDADLKTLLSQTTSKSLIVVEDLDRVLTGKSTAVSLPGVLSFMDGIVSCCGEERIMVFTMNGKDEIDPTVMRPGRIDVHIHFPLCDFSTFKILATSYLGVKDHKLFGQVEEVFLQTGSRLSQAEIGEIMILNRNLPSRALKTVITAMQGNINGDGWRGRRLSESGSSRKSMDLGETSEVNRRESVHVVREFKKLYGLFRLSNANKDESLDSKTEV